MLTAWNIDLSAFLDTLGQEAFSLLLRLAGAGLLIFVGIKLIRFLLKRFIRSRLYEKLDSGLATFTASAARIALYVLLTLSILGVLGVETASFLALFTSGGVAVALAFQGAVSNLAGGVMILLSHPFRVGEYIETAEIAGTVREINVLYTVITTVDNKRVTIPNGTLTNTAITDYSAEETRRVDLTFCVSYASDIDRVKAVILEVAESHEKVLPDPLPAARLQKQGPSALEFLLRAWCTPEDYWDVYYDLNESVKKALDANQISIPFPQLDVHMK